MDLPSSSLPLLGALIAGFFGRRIGDRGAQLVTCGLMVRRRGLSIWLVFFDVALGGERADRRALHLDRFRRASSCPGRSQVDTLTAVMLIVVNGRVVLHDPHLFDRLHGARQVDPALLRLSQLFTFFMLMLVTADNFVQMFFGWEGVGLCSYLLIGFWYERPSANAAAIKAFLVNRVGDFGFALGIIGVFFCSARSASTRSSPPRPTPASAQLHLLHRHRGPRADHRLHPAVHRRHGQIGPARPAHLAARRHGGPDAGLGADPRRHHGDRRRLHGGRLSPMFEYAPVALAVVTYRRARSPLLRGHRRPDPERHQAGHRLFDLQPARLHVLRRRRLGLRRGDLPPHDPRLLQGAAVPRRGLGDPRHVRRAGHAQDGRPLAHSLHLRLMWIGSLALAGIGIPGRLRRLLFQGHHRRPPSRPTAATGSSPSGPASPRPS